MTKKIAATRTKQSKQSTAAAIESIADTVPKAAKIQSKATKPKPSQKSTKPAEPESKKLKLIRDSFTLPESDYAIFKELKKRCLAVGIEVKKSELLRIALIALAAWDDAQLASAVTALPRIKTGRPAKK